MATIDRTAHLAEPVVLLLQSLELILLVSHLQRDSQVLRSNRHFIFSTGESAAFDAFSSVQAIPALSIIEIVRMTTGQNQPRALPARQSSPETPLGAGTFRWDPGTGEADLLSKIRETVAWHGQTSHSWLFAPYSESLRW